MLEKFILNFQRMSLQPDQRTYSCNGHHRHHKLFKLSRSNFMILRATPHTRLRARDRRISSTLIGGKSRAGPSLLLHTMLEGSTEYVNGSWLGVKSAWIATWHRMDPVSWSLGLFSKTTSWR